MKSVKKKLLSCCFLPEVLCSYRKNEKFGIMSRCSKCPHYQRFFMETEEEEEAFWKEEENIQRFRYPKGCDGSEGS